MTEHGIVNAVRSRRTRSAGHASALSFFAAVLLAFSAVFDLVSAQPSGGPYGPMRRTYQLPKGSGKIYYVAIDGVAGQSGERLANSTTLESAIERVRTGDVIVMRGGTYRTGDLVVNQGITIQPYADEQPVLKGTLVASNWKNLGNGVWVTRWSRLFPAKPADWWNRDIEGRKTPLYRFNNDMVFVDGRFLQAVGWEGDVDSNSYYIDYDSAKVYIGVDPMHRLVEITAYDIALLRTTVGCHGKESDRKGYTLRGITFTQYAYRALEIEGKDPVGLSDESAHGKDVVGTTLEDCTVSYCSRVAGYFRGDHLTIRHCRISDTSTEGVYVIGSNDALLEQNIFTRNNIENITGYYPAAVKIFNQCYRATCRDNLVIDLPNSNGIWYDVGNVDGVFVNNWVEGVGRNDTPILTDRLWPSSNGFFFEISKGAICAGNVFVNCDHGMMVLNSAHVQIYQNTFVNSMACIGRNARSASNDNFGWHASTGPDVDKRDGHVFVNNLLACDERLDRPALFVWQPPSLCAQLTGPMLSRIDGNVYVRSAEMTASPLLLWSPVPNSLCQAGFDSLESIGTVVAGFSAHSRTFLDYNGPLFKGAELGNFQVLPSFPGSKEGMELPGEIGTLMHQPREAERYVGAYPPLP